MGGPRTGCADLCKSRDGACVDFQAKLPRMKGGHHSSKSNLVAVRVHRGDNDGILSWFSDNRRLMRAGTV